MSLRIHLAQRMEEQTNNFVIIRAFQITGIVISVATNICSIKYNILLCSYMLGCLVLAGTSPSILVLAVHCQLQSGNWASLRHCMPTLSLVHILDLHILQQQSLTYLLYYASQNPDWLQLHRGHPRLREPSAALVLVRTIRNSQTDETLIVVWHSCLSSAASLLC